jgi:NitT/TauT family transport system permease protein
MIPLVWNGMMSFGGAWFFLAASESISVVNHTYALPGIGSYVAAAIDQASLGRVGIAIAVMTVMVIAVNFVFWRPRVAWAERFRTEESAAAERPRSVVLDVLRRSMIPDLVARPARPVGRLLDKVTRPFGLAEHPLRRSAVRARTGDVFFAGAVSAVVIYGAWKALDYIHVHIGLGAFGHAFALGAATFGRVLVLLAVATVIWGARPGHRPGARIGPGRDKPGQKSLLQPPSGTPTEFRAQSTPRAYHGYRHDYQRSLMPMSGRWGFSYAYAFACMTLISADDR